MTINYDFIQNKINTNAYATKVECPSRFKLKLGHVFDENKTVIWNKKEYERQKELNMQLHLNYQNDVDKHHIEFHDDLVNYIYSITNKRNQAEAIFQQAYENGHSNGYQEVLYIAEEILNILRITD